MKKLVLCLLVIGFLTGCNNPTPSPEKNEETAEVKADSTEASARTPEEAEEIEAFLDRFFTAVFWGQNLKEMVYKGDETLKSFEYEPFPLQVMWSMGAYCRNYSTPYKGVLSLTTDTGKMPAKSSLSYKNEEPFKDLSVCELDEVGLEGAAEPGIYYYQVADLPEVPSDDFEEFISIDALGVLKSKQLYRVVYWGGNLDNYFDFYFVEAEGKFYWIIWNLCACEA
jgi:hypothetical protein